ncbi:MAG: SDR family NAD(P)-dependent oxidoreductase [Odoribacter splanchnicus]
MYNPYSLEGKTILITGASSGIGRCTAIECSKMGATLMITGRNEERLAETYGCLEGEGHLRFAFDLTQEEAIRSLAESVPALDGVFFCAGVTDTTLIKFLNKEKIDRVFDINLVAPMLLTKALVQKKKINKMASLVYMSSMGAEEVTLGLGIYAASKSGLNAMVRAVANELSARKIRANSIMPMMVKTELVDHITTISKEELEKDEAKYPLGYGTPQDVAYAAIYLLSDASKWITGSFVKMDGGSTLS